MEDEVFDILDADNYLKYIKKSMKILSSFKGYKVSESSLIGDGYHFKASNDNPLAAFLFMMAIWDNYHASRTGIGQRESLIAKIQREFNNDKNCRSYKPLGDFKEYSGLGKDEIFYKMVERAETVKNSKGETILEFIIKVYKEWLEFYELDNKLDDENITKVFYTLLWRTTGGIEAEKIVVDKLNQDFKSTGKENFTARLAEGELEKYDIDIIIEEEKSRKSFYVSVKTGRAFSNSSIFTFRVKKGKNKPHYYITIKDGLLEIKVGEELDIIFKEGKNE